MTPSQGGSAPELFLLLAEPSFRRLGEKRQSVVRNLGWCLVVEVSNLICRGMEGRGFSPAAGLRRDSGALAPEATRLQGLKAHSTLRPAAAGLKPRPSEGDK
jgi:hypothetical protein